VTRFSLEVSVIDEGLVSIKFFAFDS